MRFCLIRATLSILLCTLPTGRVDAIQLFPLDDWTVERRGATFAGNGDLLRVAGQGGWIRAQPLFLDFVLRLQFRPISKPARGALLLRALPTAPGAWPSSGFRVALDSTGKTPLGRVTAYQGKVERLVPDAPADVKAVGEWRHLEVAALGDRVTVAIDGIVVSTVRVSEVSAGYVGIAGDVGAMEYRLATLEALGTTNCANSDDSAIRPLRVNSPGVIKPTVEREVKPKYTRDAMARGAQGAVWLDAVVLTDGTVGSICVSKPLDRDLDLQAIAAARKWRFKPATRDGVKVPVLVTIELTFTLKK